MKERDGLLWFRLGIWKLRYRGRKGAGKEAAPFVAKKRRYLYCLNVKRLRYIERIFLGYKWLYINEEVAHKEIIICTTIIELKNLGKLMSKLCCK